MNIKQYIESLLEELESRYPDRVPRKKLSIEETHILIGQQQVIDNIRARVEALGHPKR